MSARLIQELKKAWLTTTGAGTAIRATKASNVHPHPQPRAENISGAKIGNIQASTDRSYNVSHLQSEGYGLTAVAAAVPAAEYGMKASTILYCQLPDHAKGK
jgi:hypothetical protein